MKPKKLHILIFQRKKRGASKILGKCPTLCARLQSRFPTWRDSTPLPTCQVEDEARGAEERALSGEGLRRINFTEGQSTPPTPSSWSWAGPWRGPASSLAVLAPEMPSTLSPTDSEVYNCYLLGPWTWLRPRSQLGLRAADQRQPASYSFAGSLTTQPGPPDGLGWVRGGSRTEPHVEGGQISWEGSVAPSLLQSIPRSHGSWLCTSLLREELGMDMAQIWPLPVLPAHSLFLPSSGKPTG